MKEGKRERGKGRKRTGGEMVNRTEKGRLWGRVGSARPRMRTDLFEHPLDVLMILIARPVLVLTIPTRYIHRPGVWVPHDDPLSNQIDEVPDLSIGNDDFRLDFDAHQIRFHITTSSLAYRLVPTSRTGPMTHILKIPYGEAGGLARVRPV